MKINLRKLHCLPTLFTLISLLCFSLATASIQAADYSYQVLHEMDTKAGEPIPNVVQDKAGNIFGIALQEGKYGYGAVYKITPAGQYKIIYNFNIATGTPSKSSRLTITNDGSLYGTTVANISTSYGTVYTISPNGKFKVLHNFFNDGSYSYPYSGVTVDKDGSLYGTTKGNSSPSAYGTVYKISPNGTYSTLHHFDNINGSTPMSKILIGNDHNLYGTTTESANFYDSCLPEYSCPEISGILYKISANGTFKVLKIIDTNRPTDLIKDKKGNIFGFIAGLVLKIDTEDNISIFYKPTYDQFTPTGNDIAAGFANNFYHTGVSASFGSQIYDKDVIYKIDPSGVPEIVYSGDMLNKGYPTFEGLTLGYNGNFYSVNSSLGKNRTGTVLKINQNGTLNRIHDFAARNGSSPISNLILGEDGILYGANANGAFGYGSIYKLAGRQYKELFMFDNYVGANLSELVRTAEGDLFGSTQSGRINGRGALFKLSAVGEYTVFHYFDDNHGYHVGFNLGSDGNFYGTTWDSQTGILAKYRLTKAGDYSEVNHFQGIFPLSKTVIGPDLSLYGVAYNESGGSSHYLIYRITPDGDFKELYAFEHKNYPPDVELTLSKEGALYGISRLDGKNTAGYFFKLDINNQLTELYSFTKPYIAGSPSSNVIVDANGNLYCGMYKLSPNGVLSVLSTLPTATGKSVNQIALGSDNSIYGTISDDGVYNSGLVFRLKPATAGRAELN